MLGFLPSAGAASVPDGRTPKASAMPPAMLSAVSNRVGPSGTILRVEHFTVALTVHLFVFASAGCRWLLLGRHMAQESSAICFINSQPMPQRLRCGTRKIE